MRKLRGESAAFELSNYDLDVRFGSLALRLTAYNGDVPAIIVAENLFINNDAARELGLPFVYGEEVQTVNEIAPIGAILSLGEAVRIGRRNLVEILDSRGQVDPSRHGLYDWGPFGELLRADLDISRAHLQIISHGRQIAEVQDLGSRNGTIVQKVELTE